VEQSALPAGSSTAAPRSALIGDVIAGVSIAGLILPEAVAYASIANLPPQAGVIALFAGLACYALIGRSRFAVVAATSSSAAVLAAASASLAGSDAQLRMTIAFALVVVTGLLFVAAACARLGSISDFIAKPVLRGFAFGLALVIIVKQLPTMLGVAAHHPDVVRYFFDLIEQFEQWNRYSLATGVVALVVLFLLAPLKRVPGALIVIVAGIAATHWLGLAAYGVPVVGEIPVVVNTPGLAPIARGDWLQLAELGFALLLVLYAESSSSIRSFALIHGDVISPNRDLFALGVSNIVSGLMQGMAVGAGYSASSANEAAGAQSRLSGAVAAAVLLLIVLTVLPAVALTPAPILAAIVIHAVSHTLRLSTFAPYVLWRRDRVVAAGAVLAVIAFGVLNGLLTAVGISMLMLLSRLSKPNVAPLGRLGDSHDYVDIRVHANALAVPGVLILRPEAPMFFANAERMLTQVRHLCAANPSARSVVLSLEETFDIDGTTIEAITALVADMARDQRQLYLARLKEPVIAVLLRADIPGLPPTAFNYFSVDDAVGAARARAVEPSSEVYA
jgi:MFS superfamily sulfate permease-like transporter